MHQYVFREYLEKVKLIECFELVSDVRNAIKTILHIPMIEKSNNWNIRDKAAWIIEVIQCDGETCIDGGMEYYEGCVDLPMSEKIHSNPNICGYITKVGPFKYSLQYTGTVSNIDMYQFSLNLAKLSINISCYRGKMRISDHLTVIKF